MDFNFFATFATFLLNENYVGETKTQKFLNFTPENLVRQFKNFWAQVYESERMVQISSLSPVVLFNSHSGKGAIKFLFFPLKCIYWTIFVLLPPCSRSTPRQSLLNSESSSERSMNLSVVKKSETYVAEAAKEKGCYVNGRQPRGRKAGLWGLEFSS